MTHIEELALHLFGQLRDGDLKRSDIELIEDAIGNVYEEGKRDADAALRARLEASEKELAQRTGWQRCQTHGEINADHHWGCPDCVRELRTQLATAHEQHNKTEQLRFNLEREYQALTTRCERLEEALGAFTSGGEWGKWLAWLVEGAPTREEGIAAAKIIVRCQCAADKALTPTTPAGKEEG